MPTCGKQNIIWFCPLFYVIVLHVLICPNYTKYQLYHLNYIYIWNIAHLPIMIEWIFLHFEKSEKMMEDKKLP